MTPSVLALLWLAAGQTSSPQGARPAATAPRSVPAVPLPPPPATGATQPAAASAGEEPTEGESEPPTLESQLPPISGQSFDTRRKVEITPGIGLSFNDAFFQNFVLELAFGYHFAEPFYVGLRGGYGFSTSAGRVNSCNTSTGVPVCGPPTAAQLKRLPGAIKGTASVEGGWTPFAGKVNLFAELVIHTDFSLLFGVGAMFITPPEGSTNPKNAPMISPGLGERFFFSNSLALSLELRDYMYASGGLQNQLMFNVGLAFLL
jgi:outer membrane beta-barrel protein